MELADSRSLGGYIAAVLADEAVDADTRLPRRGVYTPLEHRRALLPDTTVVRGARGVGKTVWFRSLQVETLRSSAASEYRLPALRDPLVAVGYGNLLEPDLYPSAADLLEMTDVASPSEIWSAVVLKVLGSPVMASLTSWTSRARAVHNDPRVVPREYARLDREMESEERTALVLFDALDRMSASRPVTDRLVRGLLQVALDLRVGTRNIRAKVFARPDLLDSARFTDASKLDANRVDLTWSSTSLFGLFFTTLGNGGGSDAADFRAQTGAWRQGLDGRWRSDVLSADQSAQAHLFTKIAGPYMGSSIKRGRTYQWLPSHLADGRGMVSPRSFLTALRQAAERTSTLRGGHEYAIHRDELKEGVRFASQGRVTEIEEDLPWVPLLVRPLEGLQVPLAQSDVFDRWRTQDVLGRLEHMQEPRISAELSEVRVGPRDVLDEHAVLEQLADVGVVTYRYDGRVDLPDVYRLAFGLGRKGGIPRVAVN
ncbi:hypothetical protein [Pseudokineococcus marinus]|nr:hypothetical protein [Pseudokineococcus marinus]